MKRRVGILVFPGVTMLDVTGPAEVFSRAEDPSTGKRGYEVLLISEEGGTVRGFGGLSFADTIPADDIEELHTFLVAGADALTRQPLTATLLAATARLAAVSQRIGSVCTGAFVLAELGLLDGRRATTHWRESAELARRYPKVCVDHNVLHAQDGNLHTSAGISAGMDLALSMVEDDFGAAAARHVAREIVAYMHRPGNQSQFSAALEAPHPQSSALRPVVAAITADPAGKYSLATMAKMANLSERQLRRLFNDELGVTPSRWLERVRVDRACQLLLEGHAVSMAAALSGFGNDERLRRAFARHLQATPSEYRERFTTTQ